LGSVWHDQPAQRLLPDPEEVEGMRWPPGRGWTVVAIVIVGLTVLGVAGRLLAPRLAESPGVATPPTPTGTIRIVPLTEQPSDPPPMTWSTVPAAASGEPGRLTAGGARLRLPGGWQGRTTSEGGLLILQAANFSLAAHDRGEDPIKAMTRGQVVVTLSTGTGCCPAISISASPTIGASDFRHDRRVPVGRPLAMKVVRRHGRIFFISARFGARPPAPSLLRQANQLLASLTVT
jgi:hypothetical protein